MKKILVPTDLSPLSDCACKLALKLAGPMGAAVKLISVVSNPVNTEIGSAHSDLINTIPGNGRFLADQEILAQSLKLYASQKEIQFTKVLIGNVAKKIVEEANKDDVVLVVMGTSGASGLKALLNGSQAEKVVRNSNVPVLSIKETGAVKGINDIVFVHDFLEKDDVEFAFVKMLSNSLQSQINLLQIITPDCFSTHRSVHNGMDVFCRNHHLDAKEINRYIYCAESIENGVMHFSQDEGKELIAIATHQRKGLNRFFRHSITADMINHNDHMLLTFPH